MSLKKKTKLLQKAALMQAQALEKELVTLIDQGISKTRLATFSDIRDVGITVDNVIVLRVRVIIENNEILVECWRTNLTESS